MGKITAEQLKPVLDAVQAGVGLAGCHGGMCDAFRDNTDWQFMTGGQWVAHPGNDGVKYTVRITDKSHPITSGIADFEVVSEQYYMHVDPAVKVLATTRFPVADGPHVPNGPVEMPVLWTKLYGKGRVFYDALGHTAKVVESEPNLTIMRRGFRWAAAPAR
jgi:type 1 glutamine amidotransferase